MIWVSSPLRLGTIGPKWGAHPRLASSISIHAAVGPRGGVGNAEVVLGGNVMHGFAGAGPVRPPHENRPATPVFVDRRGRRRRWMTYWGLLVALLGVLYVALLMATLAAEPVRPDGAVPADQPPAGDRAGRPAEADVPE